MNKIKIIDLLTGKKVWDYYQIYKKSQWFSKVEIEAFQVLKLKKLLKHCYENVPYYRAIIDEMNIDFTNFESVDVLLKFPLLTKEIIQKNYNDFIPKNITKLKGVKTKQTGGTTGNILFYRNDAQTRSSSWGTYQRFQDWMGLQPSDRTLILMGGHLRKRNYVEILNNKINRLIRKTDSIDIYNTKDDKADRIIYTLKNKRISHIRSYPQYLFSIAKEFESRRLRFNIDTITTTAEPLMPEHRTIFWKIFNAETFDQYGCGEIGGLAYECEKHEGLHVAEERIILEQNSNNELITTDLDNYAMPFIRYWNADQAIIDNNGCSCGRKSKMIRKIMGRTCDYVIGEHGQFLHWAYFWHLFFDSNIAESRSLRKFQIVQQSGTELKIRLVSSHLSQAESGFIITDIRKRLGNLKVEFSYESDIENTKTGKYRPVVNYFLQQTQNIIG